MNAVVVFGVAFGLIGLFYYTLAILAARFSIRLTDRLYNIIANTSLFTVLGLCGLQRFWHFSDDYLMVAMITCAGISTIIYFMKFALDLVKEEENKKGP